MSDTDARLKVTADTTGAVGPLDNLNKTQEKVGDTGKKTGAELSAAYTAAAAGVDRFAKQVESGSKGAERGLALATIQLQKLEAEITTLKAQGKPTAALEAGLDSLRGKLATSTEGLGRFRAAAADAADATRKATQRAGEFSGSITDVGGTLKTFNPALGDTIDKISIFAAKAYVAVKALGIVAEAAKGAAIGTDTYTGAVKDNIDSTLDLVKAASSLDFVGVIKNLPGVRAGIQGLARDIQETTTALGDLADAGSADKFAGILQVQRSLVSGHESEVAALNKKAAALVREITVQKEAGEVQKFVRDEVQKTVDGYVNAGEPVNAALAEQAASLGIVATAQKSASTAAAEHTESAVSGAERRAKAEEDAAERTSKSLEKTIADRDAAIKSAEEALTKAQAATDAADAQQAKENGSPDERLAEAEKLKATIKELNALPTQTPEQVAQLDAARESLADLNLTLRKYTFGLGESGTIAGQVSAADAELNAQRDLGIALLERSQVLHDQAIDRLEKEEGGYSRLSDSMREFVDVGLKAGDGLQGTFSDAGEAVSQTDAAVTLLAESADSTAEALTKAGEAGAALAEATKEGTDGAVKGLEGAKAGAEDAGLALDAMNEKLAEGVRLAGELSQKLAGLALGS